MIKGVLLVGLGGAAGSILRFLCQKWAGSLHLSFPFGTFLVNIIGCFLIGLFFSYATKHVNFNYDIQLLLMTGLCGGFTTFSAFTLEGMGLIKQDRIGMFLFYLAASVLLGLFATWIGMRLVK